MLLISIACVTLCLVYPPVSHYNMEHDYNNNMNLYSLHKGIQIKHKSAEQVLCKFLTQYLFLDFDFLSELVCPLNDCDSCSNPDPWCIHCGPRSVLAEDNSRCIGKYSVERTTVTVESS